MLSLIQKECKQIGKSLIYFAFVCVVFLMYFTQYTPEGFHEALKAPVKVNDLSSYYKENHNYPYGTENADIPKQIVSAATYNLYIEYSNGTYDAYPFSIHQSVRLNTKHTKRVEEILMQITGKSLSELLILCKQNKWKDINFSSAEKHYAHFKKLMAEVDTMLGGGSNYSKENLIQFGTRPITYKEAVKTYNDLVYKDKISNGLARLFSDYMGITMGLFPIFVVISFIVKDRKSNMKELVYSRKLSSGKLVFSRYTALVIMLMVPVLLLAAFSTVQCLLMAEKFKLSIDPLAFFKYSLGWIMPTVMASASVGMFLTFLTETPLALPVQLIWFFFSLTKGQLVGNYNLSQLMLRFNTIGANDMFVTNLTKIFINRIFYVALSGVFVAASIYILSQKRMGRIDFHAKLSGYLAGFKSKLKNSFSK